MSDVNFKSFTKHRKTDPSDPGFSIPGAKLRWISGRVRESSESTGLWMPIRKSKIPKELVEHIENCFPSAFSEGDTVRRGSGELILAYAPLDRVADHRKYLDSLSKNQKSLTKVDPRAEKIGRNDYAKVTEYSEGGSTIPDQFLKPRDRVSNGMDDEE